jgi:hypothetical protein
MTVLTLTDDRLDVRFSPGEKVMGLIRDVSVPRSAVTGAAVVQSWRDEVRGFRVGLGLPRVRLLGTWRWKGHRQLVDLRRGVPAVRVTLRDSRYDELLLSTPDADVLAAELAG